MPRVAVACGSRFLVLLLWSRLGASTPPRPPHSALGTSCSARPSGVLYVRLGAERQQPTRCFTLLTVLSVVTVLGADSSVAPGACLWLGGRSSRLSSFLRGMGVADALAICRRRPARPDGNACARDGSRSCSPGPSGSSLIAPGPWARWQSTAALLQPDRRLRLRRPDDDGARRALGALRSFYLKRVLQHRTICLRSGRAGAAPWQCPLAPLSAPVVEDERASIFGLGSAPPDRRHGVGRDHPIVPALMQTKVPWYLQPVFFRSSRCS
jgi:hypothetical protein